MRGAAIPIISSISTLAATSEAWIVDIWGVMHNGERAHPLACDACRRFRAEGGSVAMLSNAPRPFSAVMHQLDRLGVPREAYDLGITSGDLTRVLIMEKIVAGHRPRLLHVGPARDAGLFAGLEISFATAEDADLVVCSGLYDDTQETPADYEPLLTRLAARGVPMICANPDLVVERGNALVPCAGALAAAYAAKGGGVSYAGKPYAGIYGRVLGAIAQLRGRAIAKERVLAIGDGIETDLRGAHAAGLRSVFVASGVHLPNGLTPSALGALFSARPFSPVAALGQLAW